MENDKSRQKGASIIQTQIRDFCIKIMVGLELALGFVYNINTSGFFCQSWKDPWYPCAIKDFPEGLKLQP